MELEQEIMKTAKAAISKSITDTLTGYHGALHKLCDKVCEANSQELFKIVNTSFVDFINTAEFRSSLHDALNQKLARSLIDKMGGELEKRVNELKQNPETRARITLAIDNVVREMAGKP